MFCKNMMFATKLCRSHFLNNAIYSVQKIDIQVVRLSNVIAKSLFTSVDTSKEELIYTAPLSSKIAALKVITITSSTLGFTFQKLLWAKANELNMPVLIAASTVLGIFTFVTPLIFHLLTRKYVIEMYYNPEADNYIAVVYSIFVTKYRIVFKPEDVKVPLISRFFTTAFVKRYPLFFDAKDFTSIDHYKRIMGMDKPIDFGFIAEEMKKNKSKNIKSDTVNADNVDEKKHDV